MLPCFQIWANLGPFVYFCSFQAICRKKVCFNRIQTWIFWVIGYHIFLCVDNFGCLNCNTSCWKCKAAFDKQKLKNPYKIGDAIFLECANVCMKVNFFLLALPTYYLLTFLPSYLPTYAYRFVSNHIQPKRGVEKVVLLVWERKNDFIENVETETKVKVIIYCRHQFWHFEPKVLREKRKKFNFRFSPNFLECSSNSASDVRRLQHQEDILK